MATYNGEKYLDKQLASILPQLSPGDEVIISDDGSHDQTLAIIESFADPRIKVYAGPSKGIVSNFESALSRAVGDVIFLADQDDVWLDGKVAACIEALTVHDLVVTDARIVDQSLCLIDESFYAVRRSGPGFTKNLLRNSYIGACMAFNRKVLDAALPFPAAIPMHDWWIGLVAERVGEPVFFGERLILYRRHQSNASSTGSVSVSTVHSKISWRANLLKGLLGRGLLFRSRKL